MNYPSVTLYTIECNCDDIVFQVQINFDKQDQQVVDIKAEELLPFLGQVVGMQMAHRREIKSPEDKTVAEIEDLLGISKDQTKDVE